MIIQYSDNNENRIEWKHRKGEEWRTAELHELIEAYEREKTGRWIWDPQNAAFICSICGAVYRMGDDADAAVDWPDNAYYCLTCGARMEESIEYI